MSELTNERLEEIASGQNTVSIPEAVELARELREAREEIERLKGERVDREQDVERVNDVAQDLLSFMLTCKKDNTPDWMDYLAEKMNEALVKLEDEDRVFHHRGEIFKKGNP